MSIPAPPRSAVGVHPIRQQLDELDALIQQMLTVPVSETEDLAPEGQAEFAPSFPSVGTTNQAAATISRAANRRAEPTDELLTNASSPETIAPADPEHLSSVHNTWSEKRPGSTPADPGDHVAHKHAEEGLPELKRSESKLEIVSVSSSTAVEAKKSPSDSVRGWKRVIALLSLPLLAIDFGFESSTLLLGPPGRWLRARRGRSLLGLTGLGLLAAAVLWGVLDWIGWPW